VTLFRVAFGMRAAFDACEEGSIFKISCIVDVLFCLLITALLVYYNKIVFLFA